MDFWCKWFTVLKILPAKVNSKAKSSTKTTNEVAGFISAFHVTEVIGHLGLQLLLANIGDCNPLNTGNYVIEEQLGAVYIVRTQVFGLFWPPSPCTVTKFITMAWPPLPLAAYVLCTQSLMESFQYVVIRCSKTNGEDNASAPLDIWFYILPQDF